MKNVIRSVTRNGRSIILTAILALILVYLFSIIGYLFFRDDFLLEVDSNLSPVFGEKQQQHEKHRAPTLQPPPLVPDSTNDYILMLNESKYLNNSDPTVANRTVSSEQYCFDNITCGQDKNQSEQSVLKSLLKEQLEQLPVASEEETVDDEDIKERACDSLLMCIITTLNHGLRNGGGIGDVLRSPSSGESLFVARVVYDLLFFFIVIIIILNLIFGVIIDTFADLRSEKQQKEEILKNTCFICGMYVLGLGS